MTDDKLQAIKARLREVAATSSGWEPVIEDDVPALVTEVERLRNACGMTAAWLQANVDARAPEALLRDVVVRAANQLREVKS